MRLGKKATEESLHTLIGTQVNFNHERRGNICGYIFDSRLNEKDEVEISCVYFKDIYYAEYDYAMDLFTKKELTMSFELSAEIESQDQLSDGTRRINDFYFTGAGLLIGEKPACDKAIVYEFAQKELECVFAQKEPKIMKTIETIYAKTNSELVKAFVGVVEEKDVDFVLASRFISADEKDQVLLSDDAQKWSRNYINKLEKVVAEKNQEENETMKFEELKQSIIAELGEEVVKDWTDEDFKDEAKVEEAKTAKVEAKEKADAEAKAKQDAEDASKSVTEKNTVSTEIWDDDKSVYIVEGEVKQTYTDNEGKESVTVRQFKDVEVYTYASVEKMKAEYDAKIAEFETTLEVKDSEIEEVRANAEKIGKLKIELADNEFVSEFKDEDYLDETKVEEAKTAKADAEKIEADKLVVAERKEEMKDNDFASDFSDEDYLNEDKVENAKLKKELEEAKASAPEVKKPKVDAKIENLDAGASVIVKGQNPLSKLLRS